MDRSAKYELYFHEVNVKCYISSLCVKLYSLTLQNLKLIRSDIIIPDFKGSEVATFSPIHSSESKASTSHRNLYNLTRSLLDSPQRLRSVLLGNFPMVLQQAKFMVEKY